MEWQDSAAALLLCAQPDAAGCGRDAEGAGLRQRRHLHPGAQRVACRHAEADVALADDAGAGAFRRPDGRGPRKLRTDRAGNAGRADRQRRAAEYAGADAGRTGRGRRRERALADVQQGLSRRTLLDARSHQYFDGGEAARRLHVPARRTGDVFRPDRSSTTGCCTRRLISALTRSTQRRASASGRTTMSRLGPR